MATRLKQDYEKRIVPELIKEFGYKNRMQVPKITKVVVNVGLKDLASNKDLIEPIRNEIAAITGQRPVVTRAKKSISNFKIREGSAVGVKVTLRKDVMYDFVDRLINFVIPRIRDFRGVSRRAFDKDGNYTLGIKEQTIFPELELDKIPIAHGMDICFVISAETVQESMALLEKFGMPFVKK